MNRRELLVGCGGLAASALAGCSGLVSKSGLASQSSLVGHLPTASLRMSTITDENIAKRATLTRLKLGNSDYELVASVVDGDTVTKRGTEPPFQRDRPLVYDDAVYQITYDVTDSKPVTIFWYTLDRADRSGRTADTVAYDDLPKVDQRHLASFGFPDDGILGIGSGFVYLRSEIPDSELVPKPKHAVIDFGDDTRGRFTVDNSHDTELKTYEYSSKLVNDSAAAFGAKIREQCEFALSGLSDRETKIVSQAIRADSGYVVPRDESLPDGMRRLAERFDGQTTLDGVLQNRTGGSSPTLVGDCVVRYDGKPYLARITVTGGKWSYNATDSTDAPESTDANDANTTRSSRTTR